MKKRLPIIICLLLVVALFVTTAIAAAPVEIQPQSAAVEWSNITIRQTATAMATGTKNDTSSADVYISTSDYPYSTTGMDVRIYDATAGDSAAAWLVYYYWPTSGAYDHATISYNSGRAIKSHRYTLYLRIPVASSLTGFETSGKFYP